MLGITILSLSTKAPHPCAPNALFASPCATIRESLRDYSNSPTRPVASAYTTIRIGTCE